MKSFKNIIKLSGIVFLIVLASVGIGIGGGVPFIRSKKEDTIEVKMEMPESNEDDTKLAHFDVRQ